MKTDLELQLDVVMALQRDRAVDATQIGVRVSRGVVMLVGEVSGPLEKQQAELAAQRVVGVRAMAVGLQLQPGPSGTGADAELARTALQALAWIEILPPGHLRVRVEQGHVSLMGRVRWQFQREAAAASVRVLPGVTGMSNQLTIQPDPRSHLVRVDIEAAIQRRTAARVGNIHVDICGSEVILSGHTRSLAERDLAERTAWGSPGVCRVIDHIVVL